MKNIVKFSGGKDSTAMLLMMLERGIPVDEIIFCDTGKEFPQIYEHIKGVQEYIKRPITVLRAQHDFNYYLSEISVTEGKYKGCKGYGWPAYQFRWCTGILKEKPVRKYLKEKGEPYTLYIGIAADEPERHKNLPANVKHPLYDWGVMEVKALAYCKSKGFDFGGLYETFDRLGCYCCPLQRRAALLKVWKLYPALWQDIKKMDIQTRAEQPERCFKGRRSITALEEIFKNEDAQGILFK